MNTINIHNQHKKKSFSPTRQIAFSFFVVIMVGSILLSLPISQTGKATSYLNHLFIATSATCVTGLVPIVVVKQYSWIGQLIIVALIQIGGLGFLTLFNMMIVMFKKKLSYTNKIVMQEALNQNSMKDISIYIKRVIKYTIVFELIGAFFLSIIFIPEYGILKGVYYSVFHAVSAFCNAGFDLLGSQSLIPYQTNVLMNLIISGLIIAGGLGFIVWIDLRLSYQEYQKKFQVWKWKKYLSSLSLHTKIVLIMTTLLLIFVTVGILLLEYSHVETIGELPFLQKLLVSFFQSTTIRTAGFASVNMSALYDSTKLFMIIFMFIGGSPAGTAGGIKTVTFALVLLNIRSLVYGNDRIKVMKRSISQQIVKRALTISIVSFFIALSGLFLLTISENAPFIDLAFEVFSAFATVGLSANLTSSLTVMGKIIIIILMYIGRIGPITMVLIFAKRYTQMKGKDIVYPDSDVLIG